MIEQIPCHQYGKAQQDRGIVHECHHIWSQDSSQATQTSKESETPYITLHSINQEDSLIDNKQYDKTK